MNSRYKAFTTLLTVIILGAVSSMLIVANIIANTESIVNQSSIENANIAKTNALSCEEIALNKLKLAITYTGNESITLTQGTCTIETITGSGNTNRTLFVNSTFKGFYKRFQIDISEINPTLTITSVTETN